MSLFNEQEYRRQIFDKNGERPSNETTSTLLRDSKLISNSQMNLNRLQKSYENTKNYWLPRSQKGKNIFKYNNYQEQNSNKRGTTNSRKIKNQYKNTQAQFQEQNNQEDMKKQSNWIRQVSNQAYKDQQIIVQNSPIYFRKNEEQKYQKTQIDEQIKKNNTNFMKKRKRNNWKKRQNQKKQKFQGLHQNQLLKKQRVNEKFNVNYYHKNQYHSYQNYKRKNFMKNRYYRKKYFQEDKLKNYAILRPQSPHNTTQYLSYNYNCQYNKNVNLELINNCNKIWSLDEQVVHNTNFVKQDQNLVEQGLNAKDDNIVIAKIQTHFNNLDGSQYSTTAGETTTDEEYLEYRLSQPGLTMNGIFIIDDQDFQIGLMDDEMFEIALNSDEDSQNKVNGQEKQKNDLYNKTEEELLKEIENQNLIINLFQNELECKSRWCVSDLS